MNNHLYQRFPPCSLYRASMISLVVQINIQVLIITLPALILKAVMKRKTDFLTLIGTWISFSVIAEVQSSQGSDGTFIRPAQSTRAHLRRGGRGGSIWKCLTEHGELQERSTISRLDDSARASHWLALGSRWKLSVARLLKR